MIYLIKKYKKNTIKKDKFCHKLNLLAIIDRKKNLSYSKD
jgi:hypothetical protein